MKAIFSFTHLPFKHLFGHLTIGFLLIGSMAQAQEAFYIYRNDGDFNGFFYDEVVEMRQSKIGVDSVEYDKWVTQEVVLADTIYRIPLAAIDSIGFQQPEIIINPDVRHMDLLGMTPYVTARDSQTLTFSTDLPANLMPQVGNVLFGMEGIFEELNFGGRVTSVRNEGSGIVVETNPLTKMSDIFIQFIGMEEVGYTEDNPQQLSYRAAGMNKIKQEGGSYSAYLFNINTALHLPIVPDLPVNGSFDANIGFKCKMAMMYQITDDVYFIKYAIRTDLDMQAGITVSASGGDEKPIALLPDFWGTFKWPVYPPFPLIEIKPLPQLAYRWGGSLTAQLKLPAVKGYICQSIIIDSDLPYGMTYTENKDLIAPDLKGMFDTFLQSDAEIWVDGFCQIGLKEEFAVETNPIFGAIIHAKTGIDFWVGPKVDGSFNVDMRSFVTSDDGPYIFRDSHIGISPLSLDMEAYGLYSYYGLDEPVKHKWVEGNWDIIPKIEFHAFPKFTRFEAYHNDSLHQAHAAWRAEPRRVIWPCKSGIVMYRLEKGQAKFVAHDYDAQPEFGTEMNDRFDVDFGTKGMKQGAYKIAPSLLLNGTDYPVRSLAQDIYVPYILEIDKDTVHFNAMGSNEQVVNVVTNYERLEFVGHGGSQYTIDTLEQEGNYRVRFTMAPNIHMFKPYDSSKEGTTFTLTGRSEDGLVYTSRNIEFTMDLNELTNVYADIWGEFKYMEDGIKHDAIIRYKGAVTATGTGNSIQINGTQGNISLNMTLLYQPYDAASPDVAIEDQIMVSGTLSDPVTTITFEGVQGTEDGGFGGVLGEGLIGTMTGTCRSHPMLDDEEKSILGSIIVRAPGDPSPFEL